MITCKRSTIPWYIMFLLEFKRMEYSHDVGPDGTWTICFKRLFGVTYVLSEITPDEQPS